MDVNEKIELVKRNTVEIITEQELNELLASKKKPVVYCGYETSGAVHVGHMVTVTKLMDLEKAGFRVKVLFADWHTWLNRKGDWNFVNEQMKIWQKIFAKLGLKNAEFVKGTSFQQRKEYFEDVLTLSLHSTLQRAMRSMQEVARDYEHATVSQMIYPLMQIADIKHLAVDVALGGIEQRKIHMLGRETLELINYKKPICIHTPLIESLLGPGQKMSSSIPASLISVNDSEDEIKKKIAKAYCPEGAIEGNAILQIAKLLIFPRIKTLQIKRPEKFGGNVIFENYEQLERAFVEKRLHPQDLKNAVAEQLIEMLAPIRKVF